MGHSSIRLKVRRRKVAHLAAQSRQLSVKNNTIPKADKNEIIEIKMPWGTVKGTRWHEYKMPEEGYPQPKSLHKKGRIHVYNRETGMDEWIHVESNYPDFTKRRWKHGYGAAWKMEKYVNLKLAKWDKKHPKPCQNDDLFKEEFVPLWEKERNEAVERIRDFVVSIYDKLPLTGRFKLSEKGTAQYQEEKIAELKDINGDGHRVNELDKNSKLLKKAQETVNKVHAKHTNLVAGNLKDHKRKKGRMILPQAA